MWGLEENVIKLSEDNIFYYYIIETRDYYIYKHTEIRFAYKDENIRTGYIFWSGNEWTMVKQYNGGLGLKELKALTKFIGKLPPLDTYEFGLKNGKLKFIKK